MFRTFNGGSKLAANRIDGNDVALLVRRVTEAAGIEGDFGGMRATAGRRTF
jgi:hypothetical protein